MTRPLAVGGNLEGKDLRFRATGSALNAAAITGTSTGGTNSAQESPAIAT